MIKVGEVVTTDLGELDYIIGPEENRIKLGLLAPTEPEPRLFARVKNTMEMLSKEQIREVVTASGRVPSREIWGPEFIKDQDGIGACQGYASAACIEKVRMLGGQKHVELSGDYAYALVNGGRDQGSQLRDGLSAAMNNGYAPANTPGLRRHEYRFSKMPDAAKTAAMRFRGFQGFVAETEQEFATGLAYGFVGVVAVHVAGAYSSLDSHGISRGGNGMGNHAVCVDDIVWDAQIGEFKYDSPNSWKTSWGDSGRCYYTFERHFRKTITVHRFYLFPSAQTDPEGDNPSPIEVA